jgi:hypothetical protein
MSVAAARRGMSGSREHSTSSGWSLHYFSGSLGIAVEIITVNPNDSFFLNGYREDLISRWQVETGGRVAWAQVGGYIHSGDDLAEDGVAAV